MLWIIFQRIDLYILTLGDKIKLKGRATVTVMRVDEEEVSGRLPVAWSGVEHESNV